MSTSPQTNKKGCFAAYYLAHYFLRTKKTVLLRTLLRTLSLRTKKPVFAACKVNVVHGYTRLILGSFRYVQAAVFYNLVDVTGGELTNKIIKIQ